MRLIVVVVDVVLALLLDFFNDDDNHTLPPPCPLCMIKAEDVEVDVSPAAPSMTNTAMIRTWNANRINMKDNGLSDFSYIFLQGF